MENDNNYFVVGLSVIIMTLVGIGFNLWISSKSAGEYNSYIINFGESVSGLKKESTVQYRGVDVGQVKEIKINPQNPKLITVKINVLDSTPIKKDTIAKLKLHGITGEVYIELSTPSKNSPKLTTQKNQYPEIKSRPSDISIITKGLPNLLKKANHAADQLNKIFSDQNLELLDNIAKKLRKKYGDG